MTTPVSLVTGYLGSGKTTLVRRLLGHPDMAETAVIVNEIGEIGIDHAILRQVDERTVLLSSGCLCCTLRGDLADELRDLVDRRDAGEIPAFRRVVVETTGLADPTPIVNTLLSEPLVRHQYALDGVIATVDAMHGLRGPESVKQVAQADVVVVTKVDAADPEPVVAQVRRLNPTGELIEAAHGDVAPGRLFGRPVDPLRAAALEAAHSAGQATAHGEGEHEHRRHDHEVTTASLLLDAPVDWGAFAIWLTMLLHARGTDILRVKGLIDTGGDPDVPRGPVLVNAVQHVVHPPVHLPSWPDDDRRSRLVLIGRGVDAGALEASLRAFDRAAVG